MTVTGRQRIEVTAAKLVLLSDRVRRLYAVMPPCLTSASRVPHLVSKASL